MSNERPDIKTKSAFMSPTRLAARRLSQHQYRGPRTLSPTGSDVSAYSTRSRRSQSMIRSQEDAEVFDQITSATGVRIAAATKRKTRVRDCSSPPITANIGGSMSFVDDFMRSLSPTSFGGSDPDMDHPYDNNNYFVTEKDTYYDDEDDDDYDEREKDYFRRTQLPLQSSSMTTSTNLDFIHNDNSFQVLANVMVDFFDARVRNGQLTLEVHDSELIDRLLPASARRHFIEAVQYRLEQTPAHPQTQLDFLTIQCQQLGLDRDGPENPIIATAMLDENETYVTLPVLGTKSKREIRRTRSQDSDTSVSIPLVHTNQPAGSLHVSNQTSYQNKQTESTLHATNRVTSGKLKEFQQQHHDNVFKQSSNVAAAANDDDEHSQQRNLSFDFPDPESTENIVQRTLLMELHEARQMMQASTSPETIEFWESHMEDLKAKYRALTGKSRLSSSSAPILPHSPTATINVQAQKQRTEHQKQAEQKMMQPKKSIFFPQNTPMSQQASDLQTTSSSVDVPLTFLQQTSVSYNAPDPEPVASTDPSPTANRTQTPVSVVPGTPNPPATPARTAVSPNEMIVGTRSLAPRTFNPPATPAVTSGATSQIVPAYRPEPDYNIPMVDVVAPADLPGGYNFEAETEGKRFMAIVPAGGVKEGETFTCYMRKLDPMAIDIPIGHWRDGVLGCCAYGCCHPVFWNSILCPLVTLAQVQYRANLDFLGRPILFQNSPPNRAMMVTIILFWIMINCALFLGYNIKWSQKMELTIADWTALAVINGAYLCFIVFVTQSTRSSLRDKYVIREQICSDLEDLCCAACCLSCSVAQMSRHTGNYDEYEAVCCSRTGLPDGVGEQEQAPLRPIQNGNYLV